MAWAQSLFWELPHAAGAAKKEKKKKEILIHLTKFNIKNNNNNEKLQRLPLLNDKVTFYNERDLFFMTLSLTEEST